MDDRIVAITLMLTITVVATAIWTRFQRRRWPQHRELLDFGTIVTLFYHETDITAADVEHAYSLIADATGVPAGELRPTDRFDRELKPMSGWELDDSLSAFSAELAHDAALAGLEYHPESIATVDDALRLMNEIRGRQFHKARAGGGSE